MCQALDIEDCNIRKLGKKIYRKILIEACHRKNEANLRTHAKGKCERINYEQYGKKEYLSSAKISTVRELYRTRFSLLPFAGNYSHDKRFAKTRWLCICEEEREEEQHLLSRHCQVYGDLNNRFSDLSDQNQLAQFFNDVLARRDQLQAQALGGGEHTTVGANSDLTGQNKPAQGLHPNGLNQL